VTQLYRRPQLLNNLARCPERSSFCRSSQYEHGLFLGLHSRKLPEERCPLIRQGLPRVCSWFFRPRLSLPPSAQYSSLEASCCALISMRTEKGSVTTIDPKQQRHYTARAYSCNPPNYGLVKMQRSSKVQHLFRRYQDSAFSCLERGGLDRGLRLSLACPPTCRAGALPAVYPRHHTSNTFIFHTSARVFRRECVRMRKVEIEKSLAQWKGLRYEDLHRQ